MKNHSPIHAAVIRMARQLGTGLRLQVLLAMSAGMPAWVGPSHEPVRQRFTTQYCIPNPRNDRAAKRQRAAIKRRNKAKRGGA